MAGAKMSLEVLNLRRALNTLGYTVRVRNTRLFIVHPNDDEVFVALKRPRPGFYGLNRVDREMWETMGAEGITVFQNIITQELIKYLYDYMIECRNKGTVKLVKKSEKPTVNIGRKVGRDYRKEYQDRLEKQKEEKKAVRKRRPVEE